MKFLWMLTISFCAAISLQAQKNDSTYVSSFVNADDVKTEFIIGVTYNSSLNYYGRTDSLASSGLYPFIGVNFKNGLYFNTSFVFIKNKISRAYAATIVESGYQFKNEKEDWAGNLFANAFFYQNNNNLVQSVLKGTSGINITNLNKIININFGGNVKLSDELDYSASAGLDHTCRISKIGKGIIVVDPSAYLYAGTQNFTKTYYQKQNILFLPAGEKQVTTNSKKFDILSYEFSMPVVYALGKMNIILIPSYVLPQNLIVIPGRTDLSEKGKDLFYGTASIKFTL